MTPLNVSQMIHALHDVTQLSTMEKDADEPVPTSYEGNVSSYSADVHRIHSLPTASPRISSHLLPMSANTTTPLTEDGEQTDPAHSAHFKIAAQNIKQFGIIVTKQNII